MLFGLEWMSYTMPTNDSKKKIRKFNYRYRMMLLVKYTAACIKVKRFQSFIRYDDFRYVTKSSFFFLLQTLKKKRNFWELLILSGIFKKKKKKEKNRLANDLILIPFTILQTKILFGLWKWEKLGSWDYIYFVHQ